MATEYITVMPGDGMDSYFGGGNDIVTVDFSALDVRINGAAAYSYTYGDYLQYNSPSSDGVTLYGVSDVRVIGGSAGDYLVSFTGNDSLQGNGGDDSLFGNSGQDTLDGGAGNDSLVAGAGGADVIRGGDGTDFLQLDRSTETGQASFSFGGAATPVFWDGSVVTDVERITITTGEGDDFGSFVPVSGDGIHQFFGGAGNDTAAANFSVFTDPVLMTRLNSYIYGTYFEAFVNGTDGLRFYGENIHVLGGSAGDRLTSYIGDDSLSGQDGNDTLNASTGADTLLGGAGDDVLIAGTGAADAPDSVDGGTGIDELQLNRTGVTEAFNLSIGASLAPQTLSDGTVISDIERLHMVSGDGDDLFEFVINADHGIHNVWGNGGVDTAVADFSSFTGQILMTHLYSYTYGDYFEAFANGTDGLRFYGENIRINGGSAGDRLTSHTGDDSLVGNGGNDTLDASSGMDTLLGGDGDDLLTAGEGGPDTIDGGAGADVLVLNRATMADAIQMTLGRSSAPVVLADGTSIVNVERVDMTGGTGDDAYTFLIDSGQGMHRVFGNGGQDQMTVDFSGMEGPARLFSGYSYSDGTYFTADINAGTDGAVFYGEHVGFIGSEGNDSARSGEGTDTLSGGNGNDTLSAAGGNDVLNGDAGDDSIQGQNGDDTLNGGAGNDTIDGGDGSDIAVIDNTLAGVTGVSGTIASLVVSSGEGTDTLNDVEFVQFTDQIVTIAGLANLAAQTLTGTANDDSLTGAFGNDTVTGLGGNDTLAGLAGDDSIDGGDGNDALFGGADADVLIGGAGDDVLDGGDGTDRAVFHTALGDATVSGDSSQVVIHGVEGADTATAIEEFQFSDGIFSLSEILAHIPRTLTGTSGNDTLAGTQGNDTISGLDGNDFLRGDAGNDSLLAGDGVDTLVGGDGDDILIGGDTEADLRDVIYGGNGNDSADGGYGNDELRGDAGNDTLIGGFGTDTVIGADGNDVLTAQAWSDMLYGGEGDDFINGGFGYDRANGGAGADRFYHLGVAGHGSDWVQDYDAAEGDILIFGGTATRDQFQVNFVETANAGMAGVDEAFIIYRPTGQIIWALVDGGAQTDITLMLAGVEYDLVA